VNATIEVPTPSTLPEAPNLPTVQTDYDVLKANREKFVEALYANGDKQIKGAISETDINGNQTFCFVGLGAHIING
jgi:hypothetical protein